MVPEVPATEEAGSATTGTVVGAVGVVVSVVAVEEVAAVDRPATTDISISRLEWCLGSLCGTSPHLRGCGLTQTPPTFRTHMAGSFVIANRRCVDSAECSMVAGFAYFSPVFRVYT